MRLIRGLALDVLRTLPSASVDAVVTDPPYGLSKAPDVAVVLGHWLAGDDYTHQGGGFMGKEWDSFVPGPSVWAECLRVLRPGGYLLCFAGTRTVDLMGMSIRLAGFEIRDTICWLYGSGFPKSLDVSKAIDKAAGAEREVVGKSKRRVSGKPEQQTEGLAGSSTFAQSIGMGSTITAPATPPAGVVLDPYIGSGTTGAAAVAEGFDCIGIDRDDDDTYLTVAAHRIRAAGGTVNPPTSEGASVIAPTLHHDGTSLVLTVSDLDHDLARQVPGFTFRTETRTWQAPSSWGSALAARGIFGPELVLTPEANAWGAEQVQREEAVALLKGDSHPPADEPYPYQVAGVRYLALGGSVGLFDDPGAGKGVQAARALSLLGESGLPALVVTTRTMKHTWREEIARWAPDARAYVVAGSAAQRKKTIAAARTWGPSVLIVGWDALRTHSRLAGYGSISLTPQEKEPGDLNGGWIRTVIADEVHKAQDPRAKQTRALWAVGFEAERRWGLTATPVPDPEGFWAVMHFLVPDEFPSRTRFRDRYALTETMRIKGREIQKVTAFNPRTEPELNRIAAPHFLRRTKAEVLPFLPPIVNTTRYVEMEAKQKRAYESMKKEMISVLDSGLLIASDPMVQSGRLLQMAAAVPVLDADGNVASFEMPSSKVVGLLELIEEKGAEQIVVFAQSRKLIELAAAELEKVGVDHAQITGPVPEAQRTVNAQRFQSGAVQVMLCTYGAGAEGITLTAASTQAMLQRSFSLIKNTQADGRCHRIGQEANHVEIIDFITVDTYDVAVFESGAYKDETAQVLLQDPDWVRKALT